MLKESKEASKDGIATDPVLEEHLVIKNSSQAVKTQLPPLVRKDKTMGDSISLMGTQLSNGVS